MMNLGFWAGNETMEILVMSGPPNPWLARRIRPRVWRGGVFYISKWRFFNGEWKFFPWKVMILGRPDKGRPYFGATRWGVMMYVCAPPVGVRKMHSFQIIQSSRMPYVDMFIKLNYLKTESWYFYKTKLPQNCIMSSGSGCCRCCPWTIRRVPLRHCRAPCHRNYRVFSHQNLDFLSFFYQNLHISPSFSSTSSFSSFVYPFPKAL